MEKLTFLVQYEGHAYDDLKKEADRMGISVMEVIDWLLKVDVIEPVIIEL
jgi:hypothetical protein